MDTKCAARSQNVPISTTFLTLATTHHQLRLQKTPERTPANSSASLQSGQQMAKYQIQRTLTTDFELDLT